MDLSGIFVPLVTPFTADGDVDAGALRGLAERYWPEARRAWWRWARPASRRRCRRRSARRSSTCAGRRERGPRCWSAWAAARPRAAWRRWRAGAGHGRDGGGAPVHAAGRVRRRRALPGRRRRVAGARGGLPRPVPHGSGPVDGGPAGAGGDPERGRPEAVRRRGLRRHRGLLAAAPPGFAVLGGDDAVDRAAAGPRAPRRASWRRRTWRRAGSWPCTRPGAGRRGDGPGAGRAARGPVGGAVRGAQPGGGEGGPARAGPHPDAGGAPPPAAGDRTGGRPGP